MIPELIVHTFLVTESGYIQGVVDDELELLLEEDDELELDEYELLDELDELCDELDDLLPLLELELLDDEEDELFELLELDVLLEDDELLES